jgi:RNA ligase (TIGR02306 family)
MSTFKCEVVPVKLESHPNADTLSIVKIWGYTVVVKTSDWEGHDRGVYIPPDSVVPYHDRFAFLFKPEQIIRFQELGPVDRDANYLPTTRVTVRRFRGVYSQGLLTPAPPWGMIVAGDTPGCQPDIGTDFAEPWGITHYEPPIRYHVYGGKASPPIAGPPGLVVPKYDVESFNRYGDLLSEGTPVYVTEKIHGCNARYVYAPTTDDLTVEGGMFCGSRTQWKSFSDTDPWWKALGQSLWIETWCRAHPRTVLYGEVFGQVQDLKYGAENGQLFFRAFDVLDRGRWLNYAELEEAVGPNERAPVAFLGPFDEALVREIAERDSVICPGQCSEGVVICPLIEMTHPTIGRVQLKIVSNRYLEKGK